MVETLKAVIYGVGEIGKLIVRVGVRKGFEFVGGVDVDPNKVGKSLGEVVGVEGLDAGITSDPDGLFSRAKPDVVFHSTGSYLDRIYPQLVRCLRHGLNVVSTCETLSYPYYRYPELAELLDSYAKSHGAVLLGTGVNPGFLLDVLPSVMTTPVVELRMLRAVRSLDASKRRLPFQRKIGVGMDPEEFERLYREGKLTGHVGYAESIMLVSKILGLELDRVEEGQQAVVAKEKVSSHGVEVEAGRVVGAEGYGRGYVNGRVAIEVVFRAGVGFEEYEEITVEGEPSITWRSSGTPGDIATAGVVVNMGKKVVGASPGLKTMADFLPSYR